MMKRYYTSAGRILQHSLPTNGFRRLILAIVLIVSCACAMAQNAIVIYQKNGNVTIYHFADKPVVGYVDNQLVMTTSGTSVMYPLNSMQKMTFDDANRVTDIKEMVIEGEYHITAEGVVISGQKAGAKVEVFNLLGTLTASFNCDAEGRITIPADNLKGGIHLVRCNSMLFKIRMS